MAVVRFDPIRTFDSLSRRINDMVGDFDKGVSFEFGNFSPRIDILEDSAKIYLEAEMPGIRKEDVKITINDENILIIKGTKKKEENTEECGDDSCYIKKERVYGDFARSFILPDNINKDSISAKFDNGILLMTLDKIEPVKPKEYTVEIS